MHTVAPPVDWAAVATAAGLVTGVVAIVISGITLWLSVIKPRREERQLAGRAYIEVRLERFVEPNPEAIIKLRNRLVLKNHGRAAARDVTFSERTFSSNQSMHTGRSHVWQLPIEVLHPGQEFHLELLVAFGHSPPSDADVQWTDRIGRHQKTVWLSEQVVT